MAKPVAERRILVIARVGEDVRTALTPKFELVDHLLEGADPAGVAIPQGFDIVLTRAVYGLPKEMLDVLRPDALVLSFGAGAEKLGIAAAATRGVRVVHTPDALTEDVADYAIAMIYALRRGIVGADRFVREGSWGVAAPTTTRRVAGSRVGVFGLGRIGQRVAERGAALGMDMHYHSPHRVDPRFWHHAGLRSLAEAVDTLVVCAAGVEETRHAVNAAVIAALGPDGGLVNIARGSIVDEPALIAALESGALGGAALDVFADEPRLDPRLLALPNVILSPHTAANTVEGRAAAIAVLVNAATAHASAGRPLEESPD